ncbi:MAG: hypothetical protein N2712_06580 [Brevinematales bacterium]|nr:hypothetical protein [Brevinematales bacterium]
MKVRATLILLLVTLLTHQGYSQIENLIPGTPSLVVKFESFKEFNQRISNIILIMFPRSYEETLRSFKTFFEDIFSIDITDKTNLDSLGINPNKEFGFGFNTRGQAFLIIPIITNIDEKIIKLQNTLYKLKFTSFTFLNEYIIATGKDFEKSIFRSKIPTNYNVYISNPLIDSITPFKIPIEFSEYFITVKINTISTNKISLTLTQQPIILRTTNTSSRFDNISYTFQKDMVSIILDIKMKPIDIISNISFIEKTIDLGLMSIITNFENDIGISSIEVLTNLIGPSTIFIYGYNNPLNNRIMFVASTIDQNLIIRTIDKIAKDIAKKRDIFKFSIFDKTFYRLPIKENHNLYIGVIFNRFIISTDRDILVGFIRNIANNQREMEEEQSILNTIINTQPTLNNTIKLNNLENSFVRQLLPLIVQSKRIVIKSRFTNTSVESYIDIEY